MNDPRIGLVFGDFSLGGIQRVVLHLARMFKEAGWDVVLMTRRTEESDLYRLKLDCPRLVIGNARDPQRAQRISDCVKREKLDVVFFHEYWLPSLRSDVRAVQVSGVKAVIHFHNVFSNLLVKDCFAAEDIHEIYRTMREADAVIALSRTDELFFKTFGCNAVYLPNPVVDTPLVPRHLDAPTHTIVWSGRFTANIKRPFEAVKIFELVLREIPDAVLVLLGDSDGSEGARIRAYLADHEEVGRHVRIVGVVDDVWSYLQEAGVFLSTSRIEGFPCSICEAMACEVPVVSYALDYLEVFSDDSAYVRVEQDFREEAARRIVELFFDQEKYKRTAVAGRKMFESFQGIDLLREYERLLAAMRDSLPASSTLVDGRYGLVLETLVNHAIRFTSKRPFRVYKATNLMRRCLQCYRDEGFWYTLKRIMSLGR